MATRNKIQFRRRGEVGLFTALVGGLVVGSYGVLARPFEAGAPSLWVGFLALSAAGILILGWSEFVARRRTDDSPPETPPAPEPLKEEVRDDRADGHCEFCRSDADSLSVEHVTPRAEGGPNVRRNLIALCPACAEKVEQGTYERGELRDKVRHLERQ